MTPERWENIKEMAKSVDPDHKFELLEEGNEKIERVEFNSPIGQVRLDWVSRPKLMETKTLYSNRIGSQTTVEKVYSEDETVSFLKVYKFNEPADDWQEISLENLGIQ